jgi:hypothetical protein
MATMATIDSKHKDGSASSGIYQQNKKARLASLTAKRPTRADMPTSLPARFVTVEGTEIGPNLDLPVAATPAKLEKLVNQLSSVDKKGILFTNV